MTEDLTRGVENSELFRWTRLIIGVGFNALFKKFIIVYEESLGDCSDGGTPGYIPNPEVKPVSADGTWGAAPWESRSLPIDSFFLFMLFDSKKILSYNSFCVRISAT